MVGLAMFILQASALAGHHQDCDDHHPRSYARYGQGRHQEWFKHRGQYIFRPIRDENVEGEHRHLRARYQMPAFVCDEDGDDCEPTNQDYDDDAYGLPISYSCEP